MSLLYFVWRFILFAIYYFAVVRMCRTLLVGTFLFNIISIIVNYFGCVVVERVTHYAFSVLFFWC
jgi:hypothetical protein